MAEVENSDSYLRIVPEQRGDQITSVVAHLQATLPQRLGIKIPVCVEYIIGPTRITNFPNHEIFLISPQFHSDMEVGEPNVHLLQDEKELYQQLGETDVVGIIVDAHRATHVGGLKEIDLGKCLGFAIGELPIKQEWRGTEHMGIRIPPTPLIKEADHASMLQSFRGNLQLRAEILKTYGGVGYYVFSVEALSPNTDPTRFCNPTLYTVGEITPTLEQLKVAIEDANLKIEMAYCAVGAGRGIRERVIRTFTPLGMLIYSTVTKKNLEETIHSASTHVVPLLLEADRSILRFRERRFMEGIPPQELQAASTDESNFRRILGSNHQRLIMVCSLRKPNVTVTI